jgi:hypothetical protein
MSLNPTIKKDSAGIWWLEWTSDPSAILYDIYMPDSTKHIQAGKLATKSRLGAKKPIQMPKIASVPYPAVVSYETAMDPDAPPPPTPSGIRAGRVGTVFVTGSSTDAMLNGFNDAQWQWARDHWDRIYAFPPYSDRWMGKMPKAWAYQDSYAIYTNQVALHTLAENIDIKMSTGDVPTIKETALDYHLKYASQKELHAAIDPALLLRDSGGRPLYIPWGCSGGSCPQYAADFSSPGWRQMYSDRVKAAATKGYGLFADDVNLDAMKAGDTSGHLVAPVVNGHTWTLSGDWQPRFAEFMQKVRVDNPLVEIVHNSLYWANGPSVDQQIKQADIFCLERGFNDSNYSASQIEGLWSWIDKIHSWGVGAFHLSYASDTKGSLFNLACALMCSNGHDFVSSPSGLMSPSGWQSFLDTDLGDEKVARREISPNIWNRVFDLGEVDVDLNTKTGTITRA